MGYNSIAHILISVFLHGCVVGAVLAFSPAGSVPDSKVYHVTLAEFSAPAATAPLTQSPGTAPPPAQKKPEQPKPETPEQRQPVKPVKTEVKKISSKKKVSNTKTSENEQPPRSTPPDSRQPQNSPSDQGSAASAGATGSSTNIGGLASYHIDAVDQRPVISRRALPDYPTKARRMNIGGTVQVSLIVDCSGKAKECRILKADPEGYFEEAALAAARKTRFIPGKVKGRAVNTLVVIPFVFTLR